MALLLHTEVSKDWHMVRTDRGVFFGYTVDQALEKVRADERNRTLELAEKHSALPLTHAQRSCARRILMRELAAARGIRRLSVKPAC